MGRVPHVVQERFLPAAETFPQEYLIIGRGRITAVKAIQLFSDQFRLCEGIIIFEQAKCALTKKDGGIASFGDAHSDFEQKVTKEGRIVGI